MNNFDAHSEDELRDAPFLRSLKDKSAEAPPPGYFDRFADRMSNLREDEQIFTDAPTLAALQKEQLYAAPAGYFEELPARLQSLRIADTEARPQQAFDWSVLWSWLFKPQYALSVAAVALLFAFGLNLDPVTKTEDFDTGLSVEELMAVIDQEGYEDYLLAEALPTNSTTQDDFLSDLNVETDDFSDLLNDINLSDGDLIDIMQDL